MQYQVHKNGGWLRLGGDESENICEKKETG